MTEIFVNDVDKINFANKMAIVTGDIAHLTWTFLPLQDDAPI